MLESRKLIVFGFVACLLGILAYVFVFADAPFIEQPVDIETVPAPPQ